MAPFGVHGWVKVRPFTAAPDGLLDYRSWWLRRSGERDWAERRVLKGRMHGAALLVEIEGIETRDAALTIKGADVGVPRAALPAPGPGEIYWSDLAGLAVVNRTGVMLGRVAGVDDNGAHPVLRVGNEGRAERLIPFVAAWVDRVDLVAGRIEVDWEADY